MMFRQTKLLLSVVILTVTIFCSVVSVFAVDTTEPVTSVTEYATDQVTVITSEPPEVQSQEISYTDFGCVLIFSVSVICGILLGKAFSFWKW